MTANPAPSPDLNPDERRQERRYFVSNRGRLVAPFADVDCTLVDISATAAKLKAQCKVELDDSVALEIENFGCYRGTVIRIEADELIIKFEFDEDRGNRLIQRINAHLKQQRPLTPAPSEL